MTSTVETKELQRTLNDEGNVNVVTMKTIKRYEGRAYSTPEVCRSLMDMITEQCDIWCASCREGFETMNTINDWEPEEGDLQKDIASFQKYLDDKHGKDVMVAYALGAYIHSLVSFSISKSEDNRCRWDSGTCGFIAVPNNMVDMTGKIARDLSDAWNGSVCIMDLYDNFREEIIDSVASYESKEDIDNFKKRALEQFGVDFNNIEVEC